ncbi:ankyrin repeat-containing protein [Colletotrichum plurivorum]|uniref:Ankyrin repeat-containing protein n=1 Tax=Colletotrichum plurivorum TaxID=2175906 RepID=A0A8H6N573_9PEZI|nr:ankyrin repeat-containing protein [Colletotrichum plurivorum]
MVSRLFRSEDEATDASLGARSWEVIVRGRWKLKMVLLLIVGVNRTTVTSVEVEYIVRCTLQILRQGEFELSFIPTGDGDIHSAEGIRFSFSPVGTVAILNCRNAKGWRVGIFMEGDGPGPGPYYRSNHGLGFVSVPNSDVMKAKLETVLVGASQPHGMNSLWKAAQSAQFVALKPLPETGFGYRIATASSANRGAGFCLFFMVDGGEVVSAHMVMDIEGTDIPATPEADLFRHAKVYEARLEEEKATVVVELKTSRFGNVFEMTFKPDLG